MRGSVVWSADEIAFIKKMRSAGFSQQAIADCFGVYQSRISEVLQGKFILGDNR